MAAFPASRIHGSWIPNRFVKLTAGIIALPASADVQYAWILFTKPTQAHLDFSLSRARRPSSRSAALGYRAETIYNRYCWNGVKFKEMHP